MNKIHLEQGFSNAKKHGHPLISPSLIRQNVHFLFVWFFLVLMLQLDKWT